MVPLLLVGALLVLVLVLWMFPVHHYLLGLVDWIRSAGWTGVFVFVPVYVAATVLFLPGSVLTLGAGFAYGIGFGTLIVWVASNLGAFVSFLLGRTLAREWVAARVLANPRFAALDQAVATEGLKIVMLTRLSPVFPFSLLNYAFGVTRVSRRDYVLGSLVGMLPGTLMYVYLGSLLTSVSELASGRATGGAMQQGFYFFGLAITVVGTLYVTRVARRVLAGTSANREGATSVDARHQADEAKGLREARNRRFPRGWALRRSFQCRGRRTATRVRSRSHRDRCTSRGASNSGPGRGRISNQ